MGDADTRDPEVDDSRIHALEQELSSPRPHPIARFLSWGESYVLVRFALLRLLGLVYLVAFLVTLLQFRPLIGSDGLEPAGLFLQRVRAVFGPGKAVWKLPTLFWIDSSDRAIAIVACVGVALALAVLVGVTNAAVMFVLWILYFSILHIGQTFYGYGWEMQLCETGFIAIFLCPLGTLGPFRARAPPPIIILLFRWLIFRIMLGAGLIKLRGDRCWKNLTCLQYHWETQPIPNPISWLLNAAPAWFDKVGAAVNHLVEVGAPWLAFGPRRARIVAGCLFIGFQCFLILSGNLSFLNWLTIVPALACFDDRALIRVVPRGVRFRVSERFGLDEAGRATEALLPPTKWHRGAAWGYALVVGFLSMSPIVNLTSSRQAMNTSFDPLDLVNTYGAFGSVNRRRYEVVIEGTSDPRIDAHTQWKEYEFPCKPGDPDRAPCFISPYHERLDWQMWFAAFSPVRSQPWIVHLAAKLLEGDPLIDTLLARDPFPATPPVWVRAQLYRYQFTRPGDGKAWWHRTLVGPYLPPLKRDSPALQAFMRAHGWTH